MAGHSKWSKIKRDKAANDAKRGTLFTKIGNQIAVAARQGTDPTTNATLAMVIDKAKAANMPGSTIDRAIKRATDKAQARLEEVLYEGYGQGGVAILVACATDNRKRTYPEVKTAFSKHGGRIADPGSVAFNFDHCGQIIVKAQGNEAILAILEAGALDAEESDDLIKVQTSLADFHKVHQNIKTAGLKIQAAELIYQPKTTVTLATSKQLKLDKLLTVLADLPDVLAVYSNLELD